MGEKEYVTYKEMLAVQGKLKDEMCKDIEKVDGRVDILDGKVDQLTELVIPMNIAMKQTADNTKEISESLKEFTRNQNMTNNAFSTKIGEHAVALQDVKSIANGLAEKKKYNATIVVAIIGLISVFVAGLFQLAPVLFSG